jgi:hypothetical protein
MSDVCVKCGGSEAECPNFGAHKNADRLWQRGDKDGSTRLHSHAPGMPHRSDTRYPTESDEQLVLALVRILTAAVNHEKFSVLSDAVSGVFDKILDQFLEELSKPKSLAAVVFAVLKARGYVVVDPIGSVGKETFTPFSDRGPDGWPMTRMRVRGPRSPMAIPILTAFSYEIEVTLGDEMAKKP